jgi:sterol desaturase/sphingolipid hydroxylase (fatty acid hydroxylase superfamily)
MKYKSIQIFALINIPLLCLGTLDYAVYSSLMYPYAFLYISMFLKNMGLAEVLDWLNRENPYILARSHEAQLNISHLQNICTVSLVDILTLYYTVEYLSRGSQSSAVEYLLFIPQSFCFELLFDFFHYWIHRACHVHKGLYKYVHSHHHANSAITVYTTFEQHPLDLLLTNTVPIVLSTYILSPSRLFLFLFFWYKSFLEISGHLGKDNKGLSFPQCIWIPRYFGICLQSRDHNYHHIRPLKNFSKRFCLWDKVFGTFEKN